MFNDDPAAALGPPDAGQGANGKDVSIGGGGVLIVSFPSFLTGSGDSSPDIFVWETGPAAEVYDVAVSEDNETWTTVGRADGQTQGSQGFDIDHAGFGPDSRLKYVKITDIQNFVGQQCASGSARSGADIDAIAILTPAPYAEVILDKTNDVEDGAELAVGDVVEYTFTVTNTGNVDLTGVTITDELPNLSAIDPASADIAVGDSERFTATYEITQDDIDAGQVVNVATVTGQPPSDCTECTPPSDDDTTTVTITQNAALTIEKKADTEGPVALGEPIIYSFDVTNTGNVTIFDVTIADDLPDLSWENGPDLGDIEPGETVTGTATYVTTEADILEGSVLNTATVTGTPPESCVDCDPTSPPSEETVTTEDPNPRLSITKSPDTEGPVTAGDTITYTFTATNLGNVTLTDVTAQDNKPGLVWVHGPNLGTLAPGEVTEGSATYVVTEADVLAGEVLNSVTGIGTPPEDCTSCNPPLSPPLIVVVPTEDPNPDLSIVKRADTEGPLVAGETITYTFTATNTGNVTLDDVVITDGLPGLTWVEGPELGSLAPGETASGTATYEVTQDDVDTGNVTNTATGTGTPPGDLPPPESPPSTIIIPPEDPTAELTIVKDASPEGPVALGETITYTFTVTNTGNVTISDVTIADDLAGLTWVTGPELGTLRPGDVATGTATYITTEADLLAGGVTNTATADGDPAPICELTEGCELDPPSDEVTVPGEDPNPALTVLKEADTAGPVAVGDTITYTFTATNTGNVTLDDVTITDALAGLAWVEGPNLGTLAPGGDATGTATYVVTEADLLNGGITNSATGTGTPPGDLPPPESPPSTIIVPGDDPVAGLLLTKDASTAGPVAAGDTITYSFEATNTGNITLDPVVITDDLPGLTWVTGPNLGAIAPGDTAAGTATYTVTEADVVNGSVVNSATGTGTPPEGYVGDPPANTPPPVTVITDEPVTGLAVVKEADTAGPVGAGEVITYTFTATNTGNVALADVVIIDQLPGIAWVTGPNLGALAPGESAQGSATYLVTEADVLAGGVVNSATGTGTPPGDLPPPDSPPSTVRVETEEPASGLALVKSAEAVEGAQVGDVITYTFVATNTGNVTLTGVAIDDPLPGLSAIEPASVDTLMPGASATFTATYVVTQADVNAGGVTNSAIASGTPTSGDEPIMSPPGEVFVPTERGTMGLVLDKTVTPDTTVEAGDTVTYTFVVTNIGNTTVGGITISDPLPGLGAIEGPHGTALDPGETATFTATYVVTEADAELGVLANTALVSGTGPDGEELSAFDTARVRACVDPQPVTPTPEPTEEADDPAGTPAPVEDVDDGDADDTDPDADTGDDAEPGDDADTGEDAGDGTDPDAGGDDGTLPGDDTGDDGVDPGADGGDGALPGDEPGGDDDGAEVGDGAGTDPVDAPESTPDDGEESGEVQFYAGARSPLGRVLLQDAGDDDLADCVPLDPDPVTPPPAPQPQPQQPQPAPKSPGGGSPVTSLPTTGHGETASDQTLVLVGGLALLAVGAIGLGLASRGTIRPRKR